MPQAPDPITSPPPLPWQPYDATTGGEEPSQAGPLDVYDGNGLSGSNPWKKLADGGAIDASGRSVGTWPDNGASSDGGWKSV